MGLTFVFLIMAIVYLPILLLVFLSFSNGLEYYVDLFTTAEYMTAVGNTLLIAVIASVIATIIATMAATGITYMTKRNRAITMAVNQLPVINADIVTSFGLVLLFVALGMTNFGLLKLILAHVLIALPFCLLTILPKMRQLDANLIDAALDLGASPFKAFTSVIVPQLIPAMIQAFLLGFTLSLDDFVITQYNNSGVSTISTVVYGAIARRDIPDAFKALTTIIFVVILLVLVIMNLNNARIRKGIKLNKKVIAGILAGVLLLTGIGVIPVIVNNITPRSLVLKVYNWEDYIASDYEYEDEDGNIVHVNLLEDFTNYYRKELASQGVKNADKFRIEYHTFTDNEELYSKINTQHSDYDLIFPSEYMVEKMANEGLLQPIDEKRITEPMDESILARTSAFTTVYDENNQPVANQTWAIPYMIGTVGIMYDTSVIKLMQKETGMDVDAFETMLEKYGFGILFGEGESTKYKGRITMKKSARDSIGIAMIYSEQRKSAEHTVEKANYLVGQGENENYDNTMLEEILNMDGDYSIDAAREVLMEQIRTMNPVYENDNGKKSFIDPNDTSFAYGLFWSCDAGIAMYEMDTDAEENGIEDFENPLRFYAPQGTNLWTDNFAIPTYAQNTDAAYAFMNFMLNHENAALNTDYVGSQMIAVGDDIDDLKEDYGVPEAGIPYDIFKAETNYACTIFPTQDNINYSAIMHNFDKQKEKNVNSLMVDVQNKAAQLTENEGFSVNWFLVAICVLAVGGFTWWLVHKLTHRRPRLQPTLLLPEQKA